MVPEIRNGISEFFPAVRVKVPVRRGVVKKKNRVSGGRPLGTLFRVGFWFRRNDGFIRNGPLSRRLSIEIPFPPQPGIATN